ncbi:MAG: glycogen debranching enzyme family protein [Bryobacteraceae bacterium]|nr:glycogen debranching enzyme family protein [Bryobacteraceae bacterium]
MRRGLELRAPRDPDPVFVDEWLVTNGLGGYAAGTVNGTITRRYHGYLIAALAEPLGRTIMLNALLEQVRIPNQGRIYKFGLAQQTTQGGAQAGDATLEHFELDNGLPVWRYQAEGYVVEKRILMPFRQNSVYVNYRMLSGEGALRLGVRPALHFRTHDAPVDRPLEENYRLVVVGARYEVSSGDSLPPLRMMIYGERASFSINRERQKIAYSIEEVRGYESAGDLWSPGFFRLDLAPERDATLVFSSESWDDICALKPEDALEAESERRRLLFAHAHPKAQEGLASELVLAADQFVVVPMGRSEDAARARAAGDEMRTVIAGYHWFTDWGRDTMISLEGLTLTTGRFSEAGWILRTFAHYVRGGLIPNLFPEHGKDGLYHTADASLWFFHAIHRYVEQTGDRATLRLILPKLQDIVDHHLRGTGFGICVDHHDGLLRQGEEGYQLTWMDAKVADWVVTPRRGKAVEINALWYNALCLLERWLRQEKGDADAASVAGHAARARESFNKRFWFADGEYLYDVVDGENGDDAAFRPNQIFAVSLDYPVLEQARWERVVEVVRERLLTPFGLRTLSREHPNYKAKYYGDLRARDAAYHQGTVWPWLIGPFIDAWLNAHPDGRAEARGFLERFDSHLSEACLGSISEIFDAESPYAPRGCVAQAWSVAEVLRSLVKTAE